MIIRHRPPEEDRETIDRKLLSHVEKLRRLRVAVDQGIASLRAGKGTELDVEAFIRLRNRGKQSEAWSLR